MGMTNGGWPGYSGGPKGTLMPLPVGLNTQVVEAVDYGIGRVAGTGYRAKSGGLMLPWFDPTETREALDPSMKYEKQKTYLAGPKSNLGIFF